MTFFTDLKSKEMTFDDRSMSEDESDDSSNEDYNERHVRIAEQNLTLMYRPKSYSMPDLLQMDTFKQSYHKHPNVQLSTRLATSNIDIKSYLPRKTFKSKLSSRLKRFRSKLSTYHQNNYDLQSPDDIDGWIDRDPTLDRPNNHKSHNNKLLQPFKCFNIFQQHEESSLVCRIKMSPSSAIFTDTRRSRSEENLNSTSDESNILTYKPFSHGLQRLNNYRRRILSDDTSYRQLNYKENTSYCNTNGGIKLNVTDGNAIEKYLNVPTDVILSSEEGECKSLL